jgi:hypothetical protein
VARRMAVRIDSSNIFMYAPEDISVILGRTISGPCFICYTYAPFRQVPGGSAPLAETCTLESLYSEDLRSGRLGSVPGRAVFSPHRPDRLWEQPSPLYIGYRFLFPRDAKMTTHVHPVPSSRKLELYLHSAIRLHDIMLHPLSTGRT